MDGGGGADVGGVGGGAGEGAGHSVSRRGLIAGATVVGAAAIVGGGSGARRPSDGQARLIDTALAASASGAASLSDVKHVVVLMQENRSFAGGKFVT
jgi:phospholipase C